MTSSGVLPMDGARVDDWRKLVEPTIQTRDAQPLRRDRLDDVDARRLRRRDRLVVAGCARTACVDRCRADRSAARDLPRDRHVGRPADRGRLASRIRDRADDRVGTGTLPAGRYVVGAHLGPYDGLQDANEALQQWADEQGLRWAVRDAPEGSAGTPASSPTSPIRRASLIRRAGRPTSRTCWSADPGRPTHDGKLSDGDVPEWPKGAAC